MMCHMVGTAHTFEDRIIISGVGLIGGSIAAAVRKRFPTCEVIGVGRSAQRLQAAQEMGLLTSWSTEYSADLFAVPTLMVSCLPVHLIGPDVVRAAEFATTETAITDAGSVKTSICDLVSQDKEAAGIFLGSPPAMG